MWNLDFGLSFKQQTVKIVGYLSFLWSPQQRKIVSSERRLLLVACASELLNRGAIFHSLTFSIAATRALDDKAVQRTSSAELVRVVAR